MKKMLSLLLCAATLLTLLAGCAGGEATTAPTTEAPHKHTYEAEWSNDATHHWYNATCEHTALKANYGEHMDEDLDGNCDVCSYADPEHEHEYHEAWANDETPHWHNASCIHIGSVSEKTEHADADNDGACDTCGYTGGHEHTFVEEWSKNETQHWHVSSCGHDVINEQADHEDATNDGVCDVCGWYDETHTHTFGDNWKTDAVYHWNPATCEHMGAVSNKNEHTDNDENGYCDTCNYLMCTHVDYDDNGECDTCGYEDPSHVHDFTTNKGANAFGHWFIASCHTGATTEVEDHTDSNNDGICDICEWVTCGHTYAEGWTNNETHHWKRILCSCSIPRKEYGEHVDNDGDGGCDICMYGVPVPAVYEIVVDNEPYELIMDAMITFAPFTVYFPQPGTYVITPNAGDHDVRVWRMDIADFSNTEGPLTVEVAEAGEMQFYFRYFNFSYSASNPIDLFFLYSVVRKDDLVMNTMQGKVELPTNTIYRAEFTAPQAGTYSLVTSVESLEIGLTQDSMEFYKGQIEFTVEEGQTIELWLRKRTNEAVSFTFDWFLEDPFYLPVSVGSYNVDVADKIIDYKIVFTAPEDGYYRMTVNSEWLTFCEWVPELKQPRRLETMEILTGFMKAGETYETWLQTVYNYPGTTNVYDILTIDNVGIKLGVGSSTATPGAAGDRYCFQATSSSYYNISVTGGELGIIAPSGAISWTTNSYEVQLEKGKTYVFMLRGENVSVNIKTVDYSISLVEGENIKTLVPNRHYTLLTSNSNTDATSTNNNIALTWEGNMAVYVNGVEVAQGESFALMNATVTMLAKGSSDVEVVINLIITHDSNSEVPGETNAALVLDTVTQMCVNKEALGQDAVATFTAEIGGTYTLKGMSDNGMIYTVSATGEKTLQFTGQGSYTFQLSAGETIEFRINCQKGGTETVEIQVVAGG